MSRSYKKHPFGNWYGVKSQKEDKRIGNRALRSRANQLVKQWAETDPDLILPVMDEVLNKYSMPKDGDDFYWPFKEEDWRWDKDKLGSGGKLLSPRVQWFLRIKRK